MLSKQLVVSIFFVFVTMDVIKSDTYSGDLTFYSTWDEGYGSCGLDPSMKDPFQVIALSRDLMKLPDGEINPNNCPLCKDNVCVQVYGARGSVVLKVSDTCGACKTYDIDVADSVFPYLDDPAEGRVKATWEFVDCASNPPGPKKSIFNVRNRIPNNSGLRSYETSVFNLKMSRNVTYY